MIENVIEGYIMFNPADVNGAQQRTDWQRTWHMGVIDIDGVQDFQISPYSMGTSDDLVIQFNMKDGRVIHMAKPGEYNGSKYLTYRNLANMWRAAN